MAGPDSPHAMSSFWQPAPLAQWGEPFAPPGGGPGEPAAEAEAGDGAGGGAPSTLAEAVRAGSPHRVGEDGSFLEASAAFASAGDAASGPRPAPAAEPGPPPRADLFTAERQARFLAALAESGSVRRACARVGVSPECVYRLRRREALFAAGWDGALVLARRVAEDVLAARALDGVEEPVFYRGEQVGSRLRFDARLLLAHLARLDAHAAASPHGARRAERFDELLALVAGAELPAALAPEPGMPGDFAGGLAASLAGGLAGGGAGDPVLPPERAVHVAAAAARLPDSAGVTRYRKRTAAAATEWHGWTRTARGLADRLLAGADTPAPGPLPALGTLSTVSTGALGAALAARGGTPAMPG